MDGRLLLPLLTVIPLGTAPLASLRVLISCKDSSQVGLGPTSTAPFHLNLLFKRLISKCSHSVTLGVGTSTYEFRGNTIRPVVEGYHADFDDLRTTGHPIPVGDGLFCSKNRAEGSIGLSVLPSLFPLSRGAIRPNVTLVRLVTCSSSASLFSSLGR